MLVLKIIGLSLGSILILFLVTKLDGNREMSQLTMFDYIIGITIGSIAAEMSTSLEDNFLEPLIAIIVYGVVTMLISIITSKSIKSRRLVLGKSKILLNNGILYQENFKSSKMDLNEFLMECRAKGFFNLSDIQTVILEPNGKLSILPIAQKRPLTPEDMKLSPSQDGLVYNLIVDGKILNENLKHSGHDENWLKQELSKQGFQNIQSVFLATCDSNHHLSVYEKNPKQNKHDIFE